MGSMAEACRRRERPARMAVRMTRRMSLGARGGGGRQADPISARRRPPKPRPSLCSFPLFVTRPLEVRGHCPQTAQAAPPAPPAADESRSRREPTGFRPRRIPSPIRELGFHQRRPTPPPPDRLRGGSLRPWWRLIRWLVRSAWSPFWPGSWRLPAAAAWVGATPAPRPGGRRSWSSAVAWGDADRAPSRCMPRRSRPPARRRPATPAAIPAVGRLRPPVATTGRWFIDPAVLLPGAGGRRGPGVGTGIRSSPAYNRGSHPTQEPPCSNRSRPR
jgi:hypothetical protein